MTDKTELVESHSIIQVIERAALNPEVDMDKMERLLVMKERMDDKAAEQIYNTAMARVQEKLPIVIRESDNLQTNSKYAKEDAISKAIRPIYTPEGFSLSFDTDDSPLTDHIRVICHVAHSGGHTKHKHLDYPYDLTGPKGTVNKTKIHAYKSTISYARNTLTCMAFNVATGDDDDGQTSEPVETITEDQLAELMAKIEEVGASKDQFLKVCKVDSFDQLPASKYSRAIKILEERI